MKLEQQISNWLKDYLNSCSLNCFVVGVSGGIDSALVSTLCAQTNCKTFLLSLPINQANDQLERARNHIEWLKCNYSNVTSMEIDLTETFNVFKSLFTLKDNLALANSKSRLRMTSLYHVASTYKGLVVGTGNKIEDFGVGFFTKYGDGGVDISPIADLTKTQVKLLAKELKISDNIINAKPTDGLWEDNRSDEEQLGASYEELEWAMSNLNIPVLDLTERQLEIIKIYKNYNLKNQHKINPIPVFKLKDNA